MTKNEKTSGEYEPTLLDVLEAVQTGFMKMEEKMEARFDGVDERLEAIDYRVTAVEKRTGALEIVTEDMKETLEGVARAVDKDARAIVNHEHRIKHLEKACA